MLYVPMIAVIRVRDTGDLFGVWPWCIVPHSVVRKEVCREWLLNQKLSNQKRYQFNYWVDSCQKLDTFHDANL